MWLRLSLVLLTGAAVAAAQSGPMAFTPIGTTSDAGFFSLREYEGKLFAGTYGTPRSYTWDGSVWKEVTGDLWTAGESLFDMTPFSVDGKLYGTTESSGKVFRFEGTGWKQVFDTGDAYVNGYSIVEFKGYLFTGFRDFPNTGFRIVRSPDGVNWSTVWMSSSFSEGRFVVYNGHLYVLGVRYGVDRGEAYRTSDPLSNNWGAPVFVEDGRNLGGRGIVWNGKLYFGTEEWPYDADGRGAVYSWDGTMLTEVFNPPFADDAQGFTALEVFNGKLYAISRTGWRTPGNAKLYQINPGGKGELVTTFPEAEGWALEVYNGKLYAGTRQEGGNGKVYMSVGSETPGTPPPTSGPADYIPKGLGIPNAPFAGALPRRRRATTPTPASRGVPERLQRPPSPPLEGTRRG